MEDEFSNFRPAPSVRADVQAKEYRNFQSVSAMSPRVVGLGEGIERGLGSGAAESDLPLAAMSDAAFRNRTAAEQILSRRRDQESLLDPRDPEYSNKFKNLINNWVIEDHVRAAGLRKEPPDRSLRSLFLNQARRYALHPEERYDGPVTEFAAGAANVAGRLPTALLEQAVGGPLGRAAAAVGAFGAPDYMVTRDRLMHEGVSDEDSENAAEVSGVVSTATAMLPLGPKGGPLKRTVTGGLGTLVAAPVARGLENQALPDNRLDLKQPIESWKQAWQDFSFGAAMHGIFGKRAEKKPSDLSNKVSAGKSPGPDRKSNDLPSGDKPPPAGSPPATSTAHVQAQDGPPKVASSPTVSGEGRLIGAPAASVKAGRPRTGGAAAEVGGKADKVVDEETVSTGLDAGAEAAGTSPKANENPAAKIGKPIGRFAELQGEHEGPSQAYEDAARLTGLHLNIDVAHGPADMPANVPMRYRLGNRSIEVNPGYRMNRAEEAQFMAEELVHAVDHLGGQRTISGGSKRLDPNSGDIAQEAMGHFKAGSEYYNDLRYPLADAEMYDGRKRAELFARLGTLYFANPEQMKRVLPLAHGAFDEQFRFAGPEEKPTESVQGKVWTGAGGLFQEDGGQRQVGPVLRGSEAGGGQQPSDPLGRLRQGAVRDFRIGDLRNSISRSFESPLSGARVRLDYLESNTAPPQAGRVVSGPRDTETRRPADAVNKDGLPIRTGDNVGLSAGMSKDNVTSVHDGSRPEWVSATHTDENGRRSQRPFSLLESTDHHERVEKSQLDAGHTYPEAHRAATEAEHGRMRQMGFDPNEIEALQKPYINQAAHRARALGNTTPEVTGEPYQDSGENAMRADGGVPDPRFVLDRDGNKYTEPVHGKLLDSIEIVSGKRGDGSFAVMDPHSGMVFSRGRTLQQARTSAEGKARNLGRLRLQKQFDAAPPLSQQQLRERYKEQYPEARIGRQAERPTAQMMGGSSRELEDAQAPTRVADGPGGDARPPDPLNDAANRAPEQGAHSFPRETTRDEQPAPDQQGDEATASAADNASPGEEQDDETAVAGRVIRTLGKLSRRLLYLGRTPSKYSKTGRKALELMRLKGNVRGEGELLKGNPNNLYIKAPDGTWHFIDDKIDMAHTNDAVTWWNNIGRFFGAKAKEVRHFMLDAENYTLLPRSWNRAAGAKLGQTERYLPPAPRAQTSSGR